MPSVRCVASGLPQASRRGLSALELQSKPDLWASTAIFVTVDEGGGYYDSGYVEPLDFYGDGTRIPLMVELELPRIIGRSRRRPDR
jgi:phospholipase C